MKRGALGSRPVAPSAVKWMVRTLEEAGYETWAVGGAVRDVFMGLESGDWDLATRAHPDEVRRLFRRTVPLGIEHGTVGVLDREGTLVEVTTFRRDVETFGRHAVVEFADTLEEDLGRRDFTINAVAWHPLKEEIRDPFGGLDDLERGVLRTVGDPAARFREDFLRVLRAIRFAGRFGLTVTAPTWEALVGEVDHLSDLSPERVRDELMKVLELDPVPSGALSLWAASGALDRVAPELAAVGRLDGVQPGSPDAWVLSCIAVDALPPTRPLVRLGALLQDVGRPPPGPPEPDLDDSGEASDRAALGHRRAAALLTRMRFSNAAIERVAGLVGGASAPPSTIDAPDLRRWLSRVGPECVPDLVRIWGARARVATALGSKCPDPDEVARLGRRLRAELRSGAPIAVGDLALDGRDLIRMGRKPGPLFGEILHSLLERVLEEPELNRKDVLAEMVEREWPIAGTAP